MARQRDKNTAHCFLQTVLPLSKCQQRYCAMLQLHLRSSGPLAAGSWLLCMQHCQQTSKAPVLSDSHGEDRSRSNRGCSGRQDTTCTEPENAPCQRLSAHMAWLLLDGMLHGCIRQGAVACALYTACTADGLDALSCRPQVKIMHTAAGNASFESMLPALGCHYSCLIQV